MVSIVKALRELFAIAPVHQLGASIRWAVLVGCALFVVIYSLEVVTGADRSRYRSRNFLNDVLYTLFYQGGIYNVFIYVPLFAAIGAPLGFLRLEVLSSLPPLLAYVLFWVIADFLGYWVHRLQHRSELLWSFHSVHHQQTKMTFLTSNRLHVVDQLSASAIMFVPALLMGIPPNVWMPIFFAQQFLEAAQHAELDWRYGRLYGLIVSPRFHALHHSVDPAHHHANFGKVLSVWDHLFGTAILAERPSEFGVRGAVVEETLRAQFLAPFRRLSEFRGRGRLIQPSSATKISAP